MRDGQVGVGGYFYAVAPRCGHGCGDGLLFQTPPKLGQWFAIIQRVRVNDVGQANGMLSYWLVDAKRGVVPQAHRGDVTMRTVDDPEALINEAWANVYCGGSECPGSEGRMIDASIDAMTATKGLPDTAAVLARVRVLNGAK